MKQLQSQKIAHMNMQRLVAMSSPSTVDIAYADARNVNRPISSGDLAEIRQESLLTGSDITELVSNRSQRHGNSPTPPFLQVP